MTRFKCSICQYQTNNKTHFDDHLNRKIPCSPTKQHKLIKNNIKHYCKLCDQDFSRKDSLIRHNKTFHTEIAGNKNVTNPENNGNQNQNGNDNGQIIGNQNQNNLNKIETQNNIETQINNPITIINPVIKIYPYQYNDINDLTLFEQYLCIASLEPPHSTLIDYLNLNPDKPSYHNIKISNINKNIMDVHNGEKWIKEIMNNALGIIVDSKTDLFKPILEKFRHFLSNKAMYYVFRYYHYFGFKHDIQKYKKLMQYIKVNLYNNRHMDKNIYKKIPTDRNDKIYRILSKNFVWSEVEELITKMEKLKINPGGNPEEIKQQILLAIDKKPELEIFFKKFLKRINHSEIESKIKDDSDESPDSSEENFYDSESNDESDDESNDKSNDKFVNDSIDDSIDD